MTNYTIKTEIATSPHVSTKVKGDLLEKLAHDLLIAQNYTVLTQLRFTGTELDLLCTHKMNNKEIYVECKALRRNLSATVLTKLAGTLLHRKCSEAWLISTSEFGKEAKGWITEWKKRPNDEASRLSFYNPSAIVDALIDSGVITHAPDLKILELTEDESSFCDWLLLITEFGIFWAIKHLSGGVASDVILYNAKNAELIRDRVLLDNVSKTDSSLHPLSFISPVVFINTSSVKPSKGNVDRQSKSYFELVARARLYTNHQIDLHAKSKYIPEIYTNRSIEAYLLDHHSSEAIKSKRLFKQINESMVHAINILQKTREILPDNVLIEIPTSKNSKDIVKLSLPVVLSNKSKLINNISGIVDRLISAKGTISDSFIFENRENYRSLTSMLLEIIKDLEYQRKGIGELYDKKKIEGKSLLLELYSHEITNIISKIDISRAILKTDNIIEIINQHICPGIVVIDRAGGGKTNLLCYLAQLLAKGEPTILIFGKFTISTKDDLIKEIAVAFGCPMNEHPSDYLIKINSIFRDNNATLHIIIDGINESRSIECLNQAITELLSFAWSNRIVLTISCRDIYWEFFQSDNWHAFIGRTIKDTLHNFTEEEMDKAIPLYLQHFHIKGELMGDALIACRHPLLLRFFCEAHGNLDGECVDIGSHHEIRLKEVFALYFGRKTKAIASAVGQVLPGIVEQYIFSLASRMLNTYQNTIATNTLFNENILLDYKDTYNLYLRLLDEDVIIEETPTESLSIRRISFVYEEFMEYVMARYMLQRTGEIGTLSIQNLFIELDTILKSWINARGIGEYVASILLTSENESLHEKGIALLTLMAKGNTVWKSAYWSIIGKVDNKYSGIHLFSTVPIAINHLDKDNYLREALKSLARYNKLKSGNLAAIIYWSAVLPSQFTWRDICEIEERLIAGNFRSEDVFVQHKLNFLSNPKLSVQSLRRIWDSVKEHLPENEIRKIRKKEKFYNSGRERLSILKLGWDIYEEYRPLLVNGLFDEDWSIRAVAAERIKFCKTHTRFITSVLQYAIKIEPDEAVGSLMQDSLNKMG